MVLCLKVTQCNNLSCFVFFNKKLFFQSNMRPNLCVNTSSSTSKYFSNSEILIYIYIGVSDSLSYTCAMLKIQLLVRDMCDKHGAFGIHWFLEGQRKTSGLKVYQVPAHLKIRRWFYSTLHEKGASMSKKWKLELKKQHVWRTNKTPVNKAWWRRRTSKQDANVACFLLDQGEFTWYYCFKRKVYAVLN